MSANSIVKRVIGEADIQSSYEPSFSQEGIQTLMATIRARFIKERVSGFISTKTGEPVPPVSPEDAEARWRIVEPRFRAFFEKTPVDPDIAQKLGGYTPGRAHPGEHMNRPEKIRYASDEAQ